MKNKTLVYIRAFLRGLREFRSDFTTSSASYRVRDAYDYGREFAHVATFRYWDN